MTITIMTLSSQDRGSKKNKIVDEHIKTEKKKGQTTVHLSETDRQTDRQTHHTHTKGNTAATGLTRSEMGDNGSNNPLQQALQEIAKNEINIDETMIK